MHGFRACVSTQTRKSPVCEQDRPVRVRVPVRGRVSSRLRMVLEQGIPIPSLFLISPACTVQLSATVHQCGKYIKSIILIGAPELLLSGIRTYVPEEFVVSAVGFCRLGTKLVT